MPSHRSIHVSIPGFGRVSHQFRHLSLIKDNGSKMASQGAPPPRRREDWDTLGFPNRSIAMNGPPTVQTFRGRGRGMEVERGRDQWRIRGRGGGRGAYSVSAAPRSNGREQKPPERLIVAPPKSRQFTNSSSTPHPLPSSWISTTHTTPETTPTTSESKKLAFRPSKPGGSKGKEKAIDVKEEKVDSKPNPEALEEDNMHVVGDDLNRSEGVLAFKYVRPSLNLDEAAKGHS